MMTRRTLNVQFPDERLMSIPSKNPKCGYVTAAGKPADVDGKPIRK